MSDKRDLKRRAEFWNTSDSVSPEIYKPLITENAADVICKLDLRTEKFTYVGSSVLRLTGFTSQEMSGRKLAERSRTLKPRCGRLLAAAAQPDGKEVTV